MTEEMRNPAVERMTLQRGEKGKGWKMNIEKKKGSSFEGDK